MGFEDTDSDRDVGVDFGDLSLADHGFPTSTRVLLEEHGDCVLEHHHGTTTVREALASMGEATFESPAEVRKALLSGIGEEAVGRQNYSDRDPPGHQEKTSEHSF